MLQNHTSGFQYIPDHIHDCFGLAARHFIGAAGRKFTIY
jgi:hypothetical protein